MKRTVRTGIAVAIFTISQLVAKGVQAQEPEREAPPIGDMPALQSDALYFDATKARIKGDNKEAERLLQQVIKVNPNAAGAYYDLARLSMPAQPEQATKYIKKAIELQDENIWYQQQYAQILAFKNDFEEAANIYNNLAAKERYNDEYLLKASLLYQRTGKNKEALQILDKLIAKNSDNEEYLLQKQQLYLKMNDIDGATGVINQLIKNNPEDGRYLALLAEVYDNNNQPDKAAEVYKNAEKQFADDPAVLISIAEYYKKKSDTSKYNDYLKKAVLSKSLDAETQLTLLVSYLQEDNTTERKKEVLGIAEKIAARHTDNAQVLGVYGDLLSMNDEREKAVEQYKRSLAIDPSRYAVWQNLLYSYSEKKDADSLIRYSEKAMRLFPNQALVHYLNGIAHYHKKDYPRAIKAISRGIDMQPEDQSQQLADMHSMLGDVYNLTKQYEESDSSYERALRLSPDNASVLNNYSYYLSVRGKRLDDAEKMSKRSLELRPEEATFLDTYGWILYKQGKYEKAKEYIQQAIDKGNNESDGTLWDHLGDIHFKLNNTDKAVEYWKKAKEKGADNAQLDKKIQDRKLYE